VTPRERERRLAVLEALEAKRAKAETEAAAAATVHAILAHLTREQLRAVVHIARDLRAGRLPKAEAVDRLAAVPGVARANA